MKKFYISLLISLSLSSLAETTIGSISQKNGFRKIEAIQTDDQKIIFRLNDHNQISNLKELNNLNDYGQLIFATDRSRYNYKKSKKPYNLEISSAISNAAFETGRFLLADGALIMIVPYSASVIGLSLSMFGIAAATIPIDLAIMASKSIHFKTSNGKALKKFIKMMNGDHLITSEKIFQQVLEGVSRIRNDLNDCGLSGTIENRINDCRFSPLANGKLWKLVTRKNKKEAWLDSKGQIWDISVGSYSYKNLEREYEKINCPSTIFNSDEMKLFKSKLVTGDDLLEAEKQGINMILSNDDIFWYSQSDTYKVIYSSPTNYKVIVPKTRVIPGHERKSQSNFPMKCLLTERKPT